jgi:hypothetical protein
VRRTIEETRAVFVEETKAKDTREVVMNSASKERPRTIGKTASRRPIETF